MADTAAALKFLSFAPIGSHMGTLAGTIAIEERPQSVELRFGGHIDESHADLVLRALLRAAMRSDLQGIVFDFSELRGFTPALTRFGEFIEIVRGPLCGVPLIVVATHGLFRSLVKWFAVLLPTVEVYYTRRAADDALARRCVPVRQTSA